jgi:hypothetical protein
MTTRATKRVAQYLRRVALAQDGAALTDGQLLSCFIEPRGWHINADARLTAIVVNKSRVVVTFGYQFTTRCSARNTTGRQAVAFL